MINAPIFHVNGDDPEAVIFIAQVALDYRMKFKKDCVIDLVCYRRHGHNEADEPAATQPMMYKKINTLATTREIYVNKMQQAQIFTLEESQQLQQQYREKLEAGHCVAPNIDPKSNTSTHFYWSNYHYQFNYPVETSTSMKNITRLMTQLEQQPDNFQRHPRVDKIMTDRHKMTAGALPIDWGYAETLAYATLIDEGYHVRL
jgi:2-oxoglutarate dehydrogenase E1 component